jgi:hypothetical protein
MGGFYSKTAHVFFSFQSRIKVAFTLVDIIADIKRSAGFVPDLGADIMGHSGRDQKEEQNE